MDSLPDRFSMSGDAPFDATRTAPFAAPVYPVVLVAEQEDESRQIMMAALEEAGYTVWEVADGTEALRRLMEATLPMVLVAEEELPEFGGFQLAELLSLAHAGTARFEAVVLTASLVEALQGPERHSRDALPLEVLVKPFLVNELLLAVGLAADRLVGGNADMAHGTWAI